MISPRSSRTGAAMPRGDLRMRLVAFAAWIGMVLPFCANAQTESWKEFMGGKRAVYNSAGDPKAKGVEVSFDYPKSWSGQAGKRPNTLIQVTSQAGKGLELCNMNIKELPLPAGYAVTQQDLDEFFDPKELKDLLPDGAIFIKGARTTIDGQPAAWIHASMEMDRAGAKIRMLWLMFPVYYDKKLITFGCSVGDSASKPAEDLQRRYRAFAPLFQQLANSIVIHSKWKPRRP